MINCRQDNIGRFRQLFEAVPQLEELNQLLDDHPEVIPAIVYLCQQTLAATHESLHDPLTQVGNRRKLDADLADLIPRIGCKAPSLGYPASALFAMMDLDNLKFINDNYGHQAGDEVLKSVARRLMANTQPNDSIYRYGGDEFVVVAPIVEPIAPDQILAIAERARAATVSELQMSDYHVNGDTIAISTTLSVGATIIKPEDTPEKVIARADTNLYLAKNSGRDRAFGDNGKIKLLP